MYAKSYSPSLRWFIVLCRIFYFCNLVSLTRDRLKSRYEIENRDGNNEQVFVRARARQVTRAAAAQMYRIRYTTSLPFFYVFFFVSTNIVVVFLFKSHATKSGEKQRHFARDNIRVECYCVKKKTPLSLSLCYIVFIHRRHSSKILYV